MAPKTYFANSDSSCIPPTSYFKSRNRNILRLSLLLCRYTGFREHRNSLHSQTATGDFNPNSNNFNEKRLKTLCGLKQVVCVPTREGATLDLIFSNVASFYSNPLALAPLDSLDHVIIQWKSKDVEKSINRIRKATVRPIKDSSLEAYGPWINWYDWSIVTRLPTVNQKLEMFTK